MEIIVNNTKHMPFSDIIKIAHMSENEIMTSSIVVNKIASRLLNIILDTHNFALDMIQFWNFTFILGVIIYFCHKLCILYDDQELL